MIVQRLLNGWLDDGSFETWKRCRGPRPGAARWTVVGTGARGGVVWRRGRMRHCSFTMRERERGCRAGLCKLGVQR
jgi:hypothetical protein